MDAMEKTKLPYVTTKTGRGGRVYIYFRRVDVNGNETNQRLHAAPGSAAFFAEYSECLERFGSLAEPLQKEFTWRWLWSQYEASAQFKQLNVKTQTNRTGIIKQFLSLIANEDFRKFTFKEINELIEAKNAEGYPIAAKSRYKNIRYMLEFANLRGWIDTNPCGDARVRQVVKQLNTKTDGIKIWSREQIAQFLGFYPLGTMSHLMLKLLYYTGARISDAHRLGPPHIGTRGGNRILQWKEYKGRDRYAKDPTIVRIVPPLEEVLSATKTGEITFCITSFGMPFTVKGFGQRFVEDARRAGIEKGYSCHGVRKAAATHAAENGATANELMALFGWLDIKEAELYTRKAERARLALGAATKMFDTGT